MTMVAVMLVDRKGRKFLLSLGSAGIILSLVCTGILFRNSEKKQVDARDAVQKMVNADQSMTLQFNQANADALLASKGDAGQAISGRESSLVIIYSYGDFRDATNAAISSDL